MSTLTVKELAAPTGYDLKIASGETLDLKSQGTVTMPAGAVLQVVQGGNGSAVSTTSESWQATTLTATITPSSTSSKILINYSSNSYQADNGQGASTIYRGSTELTGHSDGCTKNWKDGSRGVSPHIGSWLDSPNTTSATTYTIYFRSISGASMDFPTNQSTTFSHITLMEIAG